MARLDGGVNPTSVRRAYRRASDRHEDGRATCHLGGIRDRATRQGDPLNAVSPARSVCSWLDYAL